MNLNLFPLAVLWAVMALVVLALIVIRKTVAAGEDDTLHVMDGDAAMVPHQQEIAHKLEMIDRWGKLLTIVTVAFGIAVGGLWVYQSWISASSYMAH
jgi:NADH:ubiquinone oxidoreductase subunit 3 (subunit A)